MSGLEPGQRAGLLSAKLGALVRSGWGERAAERDDFPGGAAQVDGTTGWVLLDSTPLAALGPALVWADRRGLVDVHLLTEVDAGVLARRADLFTNAPTVWVIDGTEVRLAEPAPSLPPVLPTPAPVLAGLLVDAGLEIVVEDGVVRGEVLGLEVARIVHGTTTAGTPIDEPVLEVGVGHADRELTGMLHGNLPPAEQLTRVVEIVTQQRRPTAERHPLNQLAPERWLRARLAAEPARVGLSELHAAPPAVPRPNLRDPAIAVAIGRGHDGDEVVVACSVGIHLDLVPAAADARQALAPAARLLLVMPERDAHPVTRALADRLVRPAEVIALEGDWRT
ncbi:MAG: hypothetical protein M3Q68_09655 [Actinomycetota bacterium]|nr:hypothetical protein [Actinomycetota bacterium]